MSGTNDTNTRIGGSSDLTKKVAQLSRELSALEEKSNKFNQIISNLNESCSTIKSDNQKLRKECSDLRAECNELKEAKEFAEREFTSLSTRISHKADTSSVNKKYDAISQEMNRKADKGSAVASSSDMEEAKSKHRLNTCVFLCLIIIFNIVATWLIIYRPSYYGYTDIRTLPWFYVLALVAVMFVNIAGIIIWIYHFTTAAVDFCVWEAITEFCLFVFGIVAMWLFAFHPLEKVTGAANALAVFLMLANLAALILRIIHFYDEHTSGDLDISTASWVVSLIETILLLVIFIVYVGWIRA